MQMYFFMSNHCLRPGKRLKKCVMCHLILKNFYFSFYTGNLIRPHCIFLLRQKKKKKSKEFNKYCLRGAELITQVFILPLTVAPIKNTK